MRTSLQKIFPPADDVVFVKIDPESGLLARDDAPNAIQDVFRKGTEPTQYAATNQGPKTGQLYNVDQGGDVPAQKKAARRTRFRIRLRCINHGFRI